MISITTQGYINNSHQYRKGPRTIQLHFWHGPCFHMEALAYLSQSIQVGQQSPGKVMLLLHFLRSLQGRGLQVTSPRLQTHTLQGAESGVKVTPGS